MSTRSEILRIGDALLRARGYNAFSFTDISRSLNIRNASIHYHFPTKTVLGLAIIAEYGERLDRLREKLKDRPVMEKLEAFFNVYIAAREEDKICLVGSLATDFYTVEPEMQQALDRLVQQILHWLIGILEEGKEDGVFFFEVPVRTKALLITTNMIAALQLTRITGTQDFRAIKQTLVNDLTIKK
ncbi:TetR/AcrR family transcriptional regulator [Niabella beijingensis]|uniref:TetR/AcrR family transcriptional regulator n=1 Tax=Niabella beijingensis TaxID=2872700 RepID=UPI001CBAF39E|nr:TetR/AcrR family transcriptional regulator [Niabella beijingensis]MBZ4188659.1 TetR/AcrR family transcriptional regulator [Niabella beijingensis]